jgi:hypothetical protein
MCTGLAAFVHRNYDKIANVWYRSELDKVHVSRTLHRRFMLRSGLQALDQLHDRLMETPTKEMLDVHIESTGTDMAGSHCDMGAHGLP